MRTIIDKCTDELIKKLDAQKPNVEFDISRLLKRTAMDILLNCAFGVHSSRDENVIESFYQRCSQVFEFSRFQTILAISSVLLPELNFLWIAYFKYFNIILLWLCDHIPFMNRFIDTDPTTWLLSRIENIVKQRCLHRSERMDLLQSMIDATDVFQNTSSVSF